MKKSLDNIADVKKTFKDKGLLKKALTHRSWVNENHENNGNNERLEFLGDAVLEFVVSGFLYDTFPNKEEGFLTNLRANTVNTVSLAALALKLNLGEEILLSKGEEIGGGRRNESLLADTVEALIGALYVDQGLKAAKEFIKINLLANIDINLKDPIKDSKSKLQETVQAKGLDTPRYYVAKESGPDHDKEFEVEVMVDGKVIARGNGKSKNRAEQDAAAIALEYFEAKG